ncbi:MAG: glycosyltransferase [Chloroflexi bacterium]|nr:glycosyltransferase [Chloroflexota bacterium]
MNVLLLTQVLPYPPDSGPKVKTWNVIKYLAARHSLTLVSFVRGDQSRDIHVLSRYCRVYTTPMVRGMIPDAAAMLRSLLSGQPWMMVRDDRSAMRRLIDSITSRENFDLVHADQLNMAQYAWQVQNARRVLDAHNALWLLYKRLWETMPQGPRRWILGRDWQLLKQYEGRICLDFDGILSVSHEDKAALQQAMHSAGQKTKPVTVIPIAVDTDETEYITRDNDASHILHIGTMYWQPNIDAVLWFINQVFPLIKAEKPAVQFDVLGTRPPQELLSLNENGSGINVTGYVADPTTYLKKTGVMVVPLLAGGGMRVKILTALAQGLPIVTTSLGCEGIAVEPGVHLLIADNPHNFAQAVLHLLNHPDFATELGRNGRKLIIEKYDYRQACQPLDAVYGINKSNEK